MLSRLTYTFLLLPIFWNIGRNRSSILIFRIILIAKNVFYDLFLDPQFILNNFIGIFILIFILESVRLIIIMVIIFFVFENFLIIRLLTYLPKCFIVDRDILLILYKYLFIAIFCVLRILVLNVFIRGDHLVVQSWHAAFQRLIKF